MSMKTCYLSRALPAVGLSLILALSGCGGSDDKKSKDSKESGNSATVVKDLKWCAENGDLQGIKTFLNQGNINGVNDEQPPLHLAAGAGHRNIAEFLISQGANINKIDDRLGWSPVFYAVSKGHAEMVAFLIQSGARIDISDPQGDYPIHEAASNGHVDVIKVLLKAGAKPDQASGEPYGDKKRIAIASEVRGFGGASDRYQPIHSAAAGNQPEALKFFIGLGISPEAKDGRGRNVLAHATYKWGWSDSWANTIRLVDPGGEFERASKENISTDGYYIAEVKLAGQSQPTTTYIRFLPEELVAYDGWDQTFPTKRFVVSFRARGGTSDEEIKKWLSPSNKEATKQKGFITGRYKLKASTVETEIFDGPDITFTREGGQLKIAMRSMQETAFPSNDPPAVPDATCKFVAWK